LLQQPHHTTSPLDACTMGMIMTRCATGTALHSVARALICILLVVLHCHAQTCTISPSLPANTVGCGTTLNLGGSCTLNCASGCSCSGNDRTKCPGWNGYQPTAMYATTTCTVVGGFWGFTCVCCSPGQWWTGSSCFQCPNGYYCNGNTQYFCPTGTTSLNGASTLAECNICESRKHRD
jgi:hypothetical protein